MPRCVILTLSLLLLLTACASAPSAPPVAIPLCPALPPLPMAPDPQDAPEPDFMQPMLNFLSGKLPEQTSSGLGLKLAKPPTTLHATP